MGEDWQVETIADAKWGGGTISLALDAAGAVYVAWLDAERLRFATNAWAGGTWSTDRIERSVGLGARVALAVESDGTVRVAYDDRLTGEVRRAARGTPEESEGCAEVVE